MGAEDDYYLFEPVELEVEDFPSEGYILDIGGGGEGVIGRLKGQDVIAIDQRQEELEDAAEGPLKIVMDARELKFLNESFTTVTAFFSLMVGHSSQTLFDGRSGALPSRSAVIASVTISGVVGHPGSLRSTLTTSCRA